MAGGVSLCVSGHPPFPPGVVRSCPLSPQMQHRVGSGQAPWVSLDPLVDRRTPPPPPPRSRKPLVPPGLGLPTTRAGDLRGRRGAGPTCAWRRGPCAVCECVWRGGGGDHVLCSTWQSCTARPIPLASGRQWVTQTNNGASNTDEALHTHRHTKTRTPPLSTTVLHSDAPMALNPGPTVLSQPGVPGTGRRVCARARGSARYRKSRVCA